MAKLVYYPCDCIRRGYCIRPGSVGHLAIVTKGKVLNVATCRRCGK